MERRAHIIIKLDELNTEDLFGNVSPDPTRSTEEEKATQGEREVMGEETERSQGSS